MSHVTTHVLDAAAGRPAAGVPVSLHDEEGGILAVDLTDSDGRVSSLGPDVLADGVYTLVFDTSALSTFYPNVTITFLVQGPGHYHVPLLLSPFAYSTYRGS